MLHNFLRARLAATQEVGRGTIRARLNASLPQACLNDSLMAMAQRVADTTARLIRAFFRCRSDGERVDQPQWKGLCKGGPLWPRPANFVLDELNLNLKANETDCVSAGPKFPDSALRLIRSQSAYSAKAPKCGVTWTGLAWQCRRRTLDPSA